MEVQMLWRVNGPAGIERQLLVKNAEKRKSSEEVQMFWSVREPAGTGR